MHAIYQMFTKQQNILFNLSLLRCILGIPLVVLVPSSHHVLSVLLLLRDLHQLLASLKYMSLRASTLARLASYIRYVFDTMIL
jgi:hypothetical protein